MTGGGSPKAAVSAEQPLLWNVSGLLNETAGAVRDYAVQGVTIDPGEDLRLAAPIDGRVHLARTNRGLIVTADFTTKLALQCVRCLRDIEVPIEVEIEEEILPTMDCPGLCIVCGLPLDEGIHDHPDDDIDPRLEGLRAFKPD
jgi:uncharacterized metal-binding protein YceD (DUF177 family)